MQMALECVGLSKQYRRMSALQNCTLRIPAGQVIGLVGPNGAGKTTLLHMAVGLLTPSKGRITVLGYDPQKQGGQLLKKIGFVAQEHPLLKTFTVKELITFGRKMNTQWDDGFAARRIKQLGIPPNHPSGKLSGGQQAQIALILALAKVPELLILDEPIASLDPLARREFQKLLAEVVSERSLTVIFSSHLVSDLEFLCNYLVVLSSSQLQLAEDVARLKETHQWIVGPAELARSLSQTGTILETSQHGQQSKFLIRNDHSSINAAQGGQDASLEDIILAYLAHPEMRNVNSKTERLEV